jgi:small subunit ribosomal protein S17
MAHDENESCVIGDYVKIDPTRKISKHKNFVLSEIVRPAQRAVDQTGTLHSHGNIIKEAPPHYNLDLYK